MKKITLFDGPHGIPLWNKAEAHGYAKKPVWVYNMEHPELVEELEREYLAAGSKLLLANTFAANGPAVRASSPYTTPQIVKAGMEITNRVVNGTDAKAGIAVGPISELLEPFGDLSEEDCEAVYEEMIGTGADCGAKFVYLQTFMELTMLKIAAKVCRDHHLPILASMTFQAKPAGGVHTTMFGNTVSEMIQGLEPFSPAAVGLNCQIGPDQAVPIIEEFAALTDIPIVLKANAGAAVLQGGTGIGCDPVSYAEALKPVLDKVSIIGGCCGCDPDYIREIGKLIKG